MWNIEHHKRWLHIDNYVIPEDEIKYMEDEKETTKIFMKTGGSVVVKNKIDDIYRLLGDKINVE